MIFPRPDGGRATWLFDLRTLVIGAGLLGMIVPASATGQHIALDSIIRCATCKIELGAPIELRGEHEQGSITNLVHLLQVADDGSIYVMYRHFSEPSIRVHRADGSLSALKMGQRGGGPGEFHLPTDLRIKGDTLFVADQGQGRITAFHRTTGRVLYTLSVPVRQEFLPFDDGRVVIGGSMSSRQSAGQPLHVFVDQRPGMTPERSFGLDEAILMPGDEFLLSRSLAREAGTTFWAARRNEYHLELWDAATGRLLRSLKGQRAWFTPWASMSEVRQLQRETPRPTILSNMVRDSGGLLWITFSRARAKNEREWREAFDNSDTGTVDGMGAPVRNTRLLLETVLEVIDPSAGVVLARGVLQHHNAFAGPGVLYRSWIDETGLPRAEVVSVRLVRR